MKGKGGVLHKYIQAQMAEIFRQQGKVVLVEATFGGKALDLVVCELENPGCVLGVEIHLNKRWALLLDQVVRDLKCGVSQVMVLVPAKNLVACTCFIKTRLVPAEAARIQIYSIKDFIPQE